MEDLGDVWDLITDLFDDNNNNITFTCVLRKNAVFDSSMPRFVTFRVHLDTTELTIYDTRSEEHLTAEEMEMEADHSGWPVCPQARHFAMLALEHYNSTKKMVCASFFNLFLLQIASAIHLVLTSCY